MRKLIGTFGSATPNFLGYGFLLAIGIVTLGPVLVILVMSFDISGVGGHYEFGLNGWKYLFTDYENLRTFFYSVALTIRVPIGLIIALLASWLIVRVRVPGGRYFEYLFWFAYFLPALPILTGWILLLDKNYGLINFALIKWGIVDHAIFNIHSAGGIIWAHLTTQTVPILVILLSPALRMIDRSLEDMAIGSGASSSRILWKIITPLVLPTIFVAGSAAGIKAMESFETEQILGRSAGIFVYTNKIYAFVNDDPPRMAEAMGLSVVFLVILVGLGVMYQIYLRKIGSHETMSGERVQATSSYSATTKWVGTVLLGIYVSVTIILPFIVLIMGSFMQLFGFFDLADPWTTQHWVTVVTGNEFRQASVSTFILGVVAALPGTVLFAGIAWALLHLRSWQRDVASILIWVPWAFPGIILGAAFLEIFLFTPGLSVLYGTIFPLLIAILIKELPIGVHMMRNSIDQTGHDMIESAQMTGARPFHIFHKILLPLNFPALVVVFLLIFGGAVRDIGTIILIAPPNFQTLSIVTFKYASTSNFEAAAVVGTIVALISLVMSMIAYKVASYAGMFK